jgi:hypothetical protein
MNKAVGSSIKAGLDKSESKRGATLIKEKTDPIQNEDINRERGGGVGQLSGADRSTLIHSEKKCHKGAYREDELADRMGLARNTLRDIRKKHLTVGDQWVFDGNAVLLLPTAIAVILRHLNLKTDDIPKKTPPHLLQVQKFWPNKRMLGCIDPYGSDKVIQVVWVNDSAMFKPNQIIPVKWKKSRLILACRQPHTKGILK